MKPIIFNTEMVKSILSGNKTHTRRPIKPQPEVFNGRSGGEWIGWPLNKKGELLKAPYQKGEFVCIEKNKKPRIKMEITNVEVEKVQDITEDDAIKEGLSKQGIDRWKKWLHKNDCAGHEFSLLWDSIYSKTKYKWSNNPLVWVYEFKLLEVLK